MKRLLWVSALAWVVVMSAAWQTAPANSPAGTAAGSSPAASVSASQAPAPAAAQPAAPLKPLLAEDVYKNIETFKGKPATVLLPAMLAIRSSLGVDCSHCHTPHEWDNEDKEEKQKARQMFAMLEFLEHDYFADKNKVTCWTCHRGEPKPAELPPDPDAVARVAQTMVPIAAADQNKPAEQVFKNIQKLKGVPAGRFPTIMVFFSRSLGVRCSHCHVTGAWEKDDKPEKQQARNMLSMVTSAIHQFYGPSGPIGCFTCHHGGTQPEIEPQKSAAAVAPGATPKQ